MAATKKPVRIPDILARKSAGPKITMLTAYDAWMARLLAESGEIDIILVGDSLGMVELGFTTTIPVTIADMVRHTRAVRAGAPDALIIADMPFMAHALGESTVMRNVQRLMQEGGATGVKIEGGSEIAPLVARLVSAGVPVVGHLGLQPQSVNVLGGFRRQGKTPEARQRLIDDGLALQDAGAFSIVLECVPDDAARELTAALKIPIIGIGSGPNCDGQVLVTHDMLDLTGIPIPAFAKQYAHSAKAIVRAAKAYAEEVRSGAFPSQAKTPQVVRTIADLRRAIAVAKQADASVGFVPTMGALHAGHAELMKRARAANDLVVASIFVNPLQFDRKEDLQKYPRTLDADVAVCAQERVDIVFAPDPQQIYPDQPLTIVEPLKLVDHLCGAHRPGHFRGVATVVFKLFNIVQPDRAYFGQKDAQQLAVIRRMVHDLNIPVEIVTVPTVREPDGLALSSRNKLLSAAERAIAVNISRALNSVMEGLSRGERNAARLQEQGRAYLSSHPEIRVEYFDLVDPDSLQPLATVSDRVLIAVAAFVGTTRLIDNMLWETGSHEHTNFRVH